MKMILRFFVALIAVAFAATATAQVQTGSILVKALDQQGAVVPGVTITIAVFIDVFSLFCVCVAAPGKRERHERG